MVGKEFLFTSLDVAKALVDLLVKQGELEAGPVSGCLIFEAFADQSGGVFRLVVEVAE